VKGSNLRAVLAPDMELGAGNVLLRLAEHGADLDVPRVTFDTGVDGIAAWTPLSLRTLTQRAAARAGWLARHGIGRADPVAVFVIVLGPTGKVRKFLMRQQLLASR
jgi:hypothetical protein